MFCATNGVTMKKIHHLMRVRLKCKDWEVLKEIANKETNRTGEYTSVSDLVRASIGSFIITHHSQIKLRKEL